MNSPHFTIEEFVPPIMFDRFGQEAWRYVDPRLVENFNSLRSQIEQSIVINNWHAGGERSASGIRLPGMSHYSMWSAHSFGMAGDGISSMPAEEIRQGIISGAILLPHPVRLEAGVSWLHMDVMNIDPDNRVITFSA